MVNKQGRPKKAPSKRSEVKVKKVMPTSKFGAVRYECVRCQKIFNSVKAKKYCSDSCRIKGPRLTKNSGGRVKFHGPTQLAAELEEYFSIEDKDEITPAGLFIFLGIDRKTWRIYETKPNLKRLCKWAQLKLEHYGTKRMYTKGRVADIFFMKNMGWTDKKEITTNEVRVIGEKINDEQANSILERFAHRKRIAPNKKGTSGGTSSNR